MILQINQRGSWANVAEFESDHLCFVQTAVIPLAMALDQDAIVTGRRGPKWRIVSARTKTPKPRPTGDPGMSTGPNDPAFKAQLALAVSLKAASAGDTAAADRHWREYIGLLELSMGRTGSVERLTPETRHEDRA